MLLFVCCWENRNSRWIFQDYGGTLNWSGPVQSYVLASFYWAYIVSQIVGGLATQKLGTKRVFGYSQLATALSSLCIPIAAETHFGFVIALRFIQGFASVSQLQPFLAVLFLYVQIFCTESQWIIWDPTLTTGTTFLNISANHPFHTIIELKVCVV